MASFLDSVRMGDMADSMKKFASQTAVAYKRAKQYTEEKLGSAEKTELDAHFENLATRADITKQWTERILRQTEAVLQPNPNVRAEDYLYEKVSPNAAKPERPTNTEYLGQYMIEAGNEFGPGTAYGSALVKCGVIEKKIGQTEKEFIHKAASHYLHPLKNFLEGDMKTITRERRTLLSRRLDLDAAKTKVRKAQTPDKMQAAELEMRVAQAEFDRQYEITKLLLDGITTTHASHLRALNSFAECQVQYFQQCYQHALELQKQMSSPHGVDPSAPPLLPTSTAPNNEPIISSPPVDVNTIPRPSVTRKAKVLYDYDASDFSELSLLADEVITVYSGPGLDSDWMIGERGSQRGKVPVTYLELL